MKENRNSESDEIVKVIIPTFQRAGEVTTLGAVSNAALCVTASEEGVYREHYPDTELIVHPDDIIGYSPKAQWILDRFGDVFMIDDDLYCLMRKYPATTQGRPSQVDPDTAYDLIQSTAATAWEMGAHLFGFSTTPNPVTYHGFQPFKFKGFIVGGACGYLSGSKLFFNEESTAVSDFWMCLLNAYYHRYLFTDERFCFVDKGTLFAKNSGGIASFRSVASERADTEMLMAYFGDAIKLKEETNQSIRKKVLPFERTMNLPY